MVTEASKAVTLAVGTKPRTAGRLYVRLSVPLVATTTMADHFKSLVGTIAECGSRREIRAVWEMSVVGLHCLIGKGVAPGTVVKGVCYCDGL